MRRTAERNQGRLIDNHPSVQMPLWMTTNNDNGNSDSDSCNNDDDVSGGGGGGGGKEDKGGDTQTTINKNWQQKRCPQQWQWQQ
jgi:hypothetical protein